MFKAVLKSSDVGAYDIVPVQVDGRDVVVYRSGGKVFASQRRCLHQGADLVDGIVSGGFLVCPMHGWRYHADSGVHEMSAENCLATFEVREEDGDILVDPTPHYRGKIPQ